MRLRWSVFALYLSLAACPFEEWCAKEDYTCVGDRACEYNCECRFSDDNKTEQQLLCMFRCNQEKDADVDVDAGDVDVDAGDVDGDALVDDALDYAHCPGSTVPLGECPGDCRGDQDCLRDCSCKQHGRDSAVTDADEDAGVVDAADS